MKNAYLTIRNLFKNFADFTALRDISLQVREGEFICFLGPSGCGKTTLLRAIAGLDLQSDGEIYQGGRDISWLPPEQRDFGIVFQSYALFPNLTVADNIGYGLRNLKTRSHQVRSRVNELLATVGLSGSNNKYPRQLSGGQQQRVALARAIATNPGLLLLDEPLSALDAQVRRHLRQEIKTLQQQVGITTIMVTHDQEEALSMADRIVVMNQGVIEQIGTPEQIYASPASSFVASFVGTMNFLSGQAQSDRSVQIGDKTVRCDTPNPLLGQSGKPLQVAIRPEDIRVRSGKDRSNPLPAAVQRLEFLGSFVRTELELDGIDAPLIADLSMNDIRDLNIRVGSQLQLDLPQQHIHLFDQPS